LKPLIGAAGLERLIAAVMFTQTFILLRMVADVKAARAVADAEKKQARAVQEQRRTARRREELADVLGGGVGESDGSGSDGTDSDNGGSSSSSSAVSAPDATAVTRTVAAVRRDGGVAPKPAAKAKGTSSARVVPCGIVSRGGAAVNVSKGGGGGAAAGQCRR